MHSTTQFHLFKRIQIWIDVLQIYQLLVVGIFLPLKFNRINWLS